MFRERYGPRIKNYQRTEYNGIYYHSKKEAQYAGELNLRKKAGDILDWNRQKRIEIIFNGSHICNYYVDFEILHNDHTIEYVEVKGFETDIWKLKWKLFEAMYKDNSLVRLTVIK